VPRLWTRQPTIISTSREAGILVKALALGMAEELATGIGSEADT
jgi:hypothetical protein